MPQLSAVMTFSIAAAAAAAGILSTTVRILKMHVKELMQTRL